MNEALLVALVALDLGVVFAASYLGRSWLYATIVINLLIVAVLGAKLQVIFGYETNVGNVPYAAVFFATYLLIERGSVADGMRAIWLGASAVTFFLIMTKLTLLLQSPAESVGVAEMLNQILLVSPRIALASIFAYVIAQHANVWMYTLWREPAGVHWWLKMGSIILVAQFIDSVIFFTFGFFGTVGSATVLELMAVGYVLKVLVNFLCIPLLALRVRQGVESA